MKTSELINAIKEFFLDFLGYFAPGFFLIVLVSFFLKDDYFIDTPSFITPEISNVVFVFIAYIIGYFIYSASASFIKRYLFFINGLSRFKWLQKIKIDSKSDISRKLEADPNVELCHEKLSLIWKKEKLSEDKVHKLLDNVKAVHLRNIVMSYIPESDTKIYTFMFRSVLSRHIAFISFTVGSLGLIFSVFEYCGCFHSMMKTNLSHFIIYLCLIVFTFFLAKSYSRFLSIAYRIPMAIFIAKNMEDSKNDKKQKE